MSKNYALSNNPSVPKNFKKITKDEKTMKSKMPKPKMKDMKGGC